jgi:parvulin-like peptidyl-prolyl isomerase
MPGEVRALHLLIKYSGSRNPISRRTDKSSLGVTEEQAVTELKTYEAKLKVHQGQKLVDEFAAAAQARSDCGSFKSGGDLGMFGPGQMQKPFEDATFALEVGQMSGIVHSDSGFHLILRIA